MAATTIAQEISRLTTAKADIKTAIEGKGVTVPSSTLLDGYADLVDQIQQGGAEEAPENDVNFYDYDGRRVASYSIAEAKALTALPTPPSHNGLTFQEWNWSLADIQSYNRRYIDIGANYNTSDGKAHIKISIPVDGFLFYQSVGGVNITPTWIDWGDGVVDTAALTNSHTYAQAGDYDITVYPKTESTTTNLQISFIYSTAAHVASIGMVKEVNLPSWCSVGNLAGGLSCLVSTPAAAMSLQGFSFSHIPIIIFPKLSTASNNVISFSPTTSRFSFPKTMPKLNIGNIITLFPPWRLILPEHDAGNNFNFFQGGSLCTDISLPSKLFYTGSTMLSQFNMLKRIDIPQGWIPPANMTLSASNFFIADDIVDFFNKLGTTSTTITLTWGTNNLNKLTADQKAIATDKGYTLA